MNTESAYLDYHTLFDLWKRSGKKLEISARGASMHPLIASGDTLSIRALDPEALKVGDVIAFRLNGNVVVHRLVRIKSREGLRWYCQKGDNLRGCSWIPGDRMLGKIQAIEKTDGVIDMETAPWAWINPCLGVVMFFLLLACERANAIKRLSVKIALTVICRLASGIVKACMRGILLAAGHGTAP